MYKEIISRKKIPLIIIALLSITIMLYIHEMIYMINEYDSDKVHMINVGLLTCTLLLILGELKISGISYKYSLIAGKLIINKISRTKECNVVSLKVTNIEYIGTRRSIPNEFNKVHIKNSFCCSFMNKNKTVCIYRVNDKLEGFYFSPSECLKNKIRLCK